MAAKKRATAKPPVVIEKPRSGVFFGARYFDRIRQRWMILTSDGPKPCEAPAS